MKKNTFSFVILIFGILISGAIIGLANAQTTAPSDIQYPIAELGNCKNQSSCKTFCDDSKNTSACLAFAGQHNLMSSEELTNAKKFQANGMVGPGGCKGQVACEQYCGNSTHLEECTSFAEKNGLMSDQQLKDSKKVLAAMKKGLKPPACAGPDKCNAYCSSPEHMEECMTFSLAAGVVPDNQKEQMQKTLDAIKQGAKPPACQPNPPPEQSGQVNQPSQSSQKLQSCDQYCSTHMEECMSFSLATGMVPDDQKEQMQKTLNVLKKGIKPPACQPNSPSQSDQSGQPNPQNQPSQSGQGLQACDQYCADASHVEECVKFSVAMGNMTEQQGQNSIKNGNKGPGGCIGKEACNTFCDNPDNQDTCFNFAKDNGMIPEEDLQKMQGSQQKMKDAFSSIPPEVVDCLTSTVGADVVEKMKTGSVIGRKFGDAINQCFQKFGVVERGPNQNSQNQQDQPSQDQTNQQIQPWADMCKPDESGNPTALACVDGAGKFVTSAKVGSDGKPVCPADSTAKCGDYQQLNQQGQQGQNQSGQSNRQNQNQSGQTGGPNQGQGSNPNSGQNSNGGNGQGGQQMPQQAGPGGCKGPEECQKYCASNPEVCKNFQPQQNQNQNQQGQRLPQQQPGQPNQGDTSGSGACGTGPGTCSGIGPDDINQQNQPDQMQQQPQQQQQNPPPPPQPSSFLQGVRSNLANIFSAFWK